MNSPARYVPAAVAPVAAGDFINFVDVHNAVLGDIYIAVCGFYEVAHEVFDVAADVPCFRKLGCVGLDKRNAYEFCDCAHEVRFAHARRPENQNVLFCVFAFGEFRVLHAAAYVVVVVADCDRQNLFSLVLLNYEFIEIVAYLARLH